MKCPKCGADRCRIIDVRQRGAGTWRRRCCRKCGFRWNTVEVPEFSVPTGGVETR